MTATERIRKHRAKLRAEHCGRLDVWIGGWIVEGMRQLAKSKGREGLVAVGVWATYTQPRGNFQHEPECNRTERI